MATITINTTQAQDSRIAAAFGAMLLAEGGVATGPQIKQYLVDHIKDIVLKHEQRAAANAATAGVSPVDVT
jgi:hypothetical protein